MTREDIIAKVNNVLADEFEVDREDIKSDASLIDTLMIDSLDLVDVVVLIEKNFGITLTAEDFINVKTFNDFYDLISKKLNG